MTAPQWHGLESSSVGAGNAFVVLLAVVLQHGRGSMGAGSAHSDELQKGQTNSG